MTVAAKPIPPRIVWLDQVRNDEAVTSAALAVALAFSACVYWKNGTCEYKLETIARKTGLSTQRVQRGLTVLKATGHLQCTRPDKKHGNKYRVLLWAAQLELDLEPPLKGIVPAQHNSFGDAPPLAASSIERSALSFRRVEQSITPKTSSQVKQKPSDASEMTSPDASILDVSGHIKIDASYRRELLFSYLSSSVS